MSRNAPELVQTAGRAARAEARRRRFRLAWAALGLLLLGVGALAVGITPLFRPALREKRPVEVVIPNGAGVQRIGAILQQRGVIRSAWAFAWTARAQEAGGRLKAGQYRLSGHMTLAEIIAALQKGGGDSDRLRVTIPEGFTLKQIAARLDEKGVTDGDAFLKLATDPDTIRKLPADFPLPKRTLEGYLFPDTYDFKPRVAPRVALEAMLLNFGARFARPYQSEIAAHGRALHQLVTAASLIEREAKVPDDRARIAGVLDNRLRRKMRLEIDATVLYALGAHKERVLYKDLEVDSPYNTYRTRGLPPGPIASPGADALLAALRPEKNNFLFYVARPDGSHIFTRSLAEHEAAKRQARAERRRQERNQEVPGG